MLCIRSCCRRPSARGWGIAAATVALILAGCASSSGMLLTGGSAPSIDRADQLAARGDQAGAARMYEALARQNSGEHRNDLVFSAAQAYLAARLPEDATRAATLLEEPLSPEQTIQRNLLEVETLQARGDYQQAWQRISAMNVPRDPKLGPAFLRLKQRIALSSGRLLDAIRAEDQLEPSLSGVVEIRESRAQLLSSLREASERGLKADPKATKDAVTRGWLELAPLAVAAQRDPTGSTADVQAWIARHPNHPAIEAVRAQLLQHQAAPAPLQSIPPTLVPMAAAQAAPASGQAAPGPGVVTLRPVAPSPPPAPLPPLSPPARGETVIALLLPLDGKAGSLANTVRDGFMTAYYQAPANERPRLRVYDTSGTSISEAVGHAAQEGATFIVGPLTREEVTAAAEMSGQHPPILALNYLSADHPVPADFYQYALSPENEARLAARRILEDGQGHHQGVAIVPDGDWGSRVLTAFKQELEAGGGTLLAAETIDTNDTDFSIAITRVLRINESVARHKRLEAVLGTKLQFEPRRRSDIDFIFTPAEAPLEREMRPQLRFHYAGSIPNYATSAAFDPNPRANQDLEGLMFPDMPWMVGSEQVQAVRAAAQSAWPNSGNYRGRLFAFGYDAYKLALALRAATGSVSIDGLTGHLTLDPERRVNRALTWLQIHNGEARLLPATVPTAAR